MLRPKFICDINHRIKCMAKPLFALSSLSKRHCICSNVDSLRVKRIIGWCVRSYRGDETKNFEDFVANARAPVAHHFNGHQYYCRSWCLTRDLDDLEDEANQKLMNKAKKYTIDL